MSINERNRLINKFRCNEIIINFYYVELPVFKKKQREISLKHYLHTGKFLD